MSEKKLNIALIGAGKISNYHLKGLSANEDCHLYAICDSAPDGRAEAQKEKYGEQLLKALEHKALIENVDIQQVSSDELQAVTTTLINKLND
jgi:UDP-N-acetyl-2-amino-2-deoxyglucuronate dehydrogenase